MSGTVLTIIAIAAVVVVALIALAAWRASRRRTLRNRFGSEYDHAVDSADSRRAAERDLRDRANRRDQLNLRDIPPAAVARYQQRWDLVQQQFVDGPVPAVHEAQALVTLVMEERGYPTSSADEREEMLSVDHADVMTNFRSATAIEERSRTGKTSTEELRQAMQHYRMLFDRLLGDSVSTDETYPADTAGGSRTRARSRQSS